MDVEKLYQERCERIIKAASLTEPDRVPIISNTQTFSIGYGNSTLSKCLADENEEYRVYDKTYEDFIWDGVLRYGLVRNMEFYDTLGGNMFFEVEDGTVLEHRDIQYMYDYEYEDMIKDPIGFLLNTIYPRKYTAFQQGYEKSKEMLTWACKNNFDDFLRGQRRFEHSKNVTGLPWLAQTFTMPAIDFLLSYLRGFGGITDMRRKPEEVKQVCKIIFDMFLMPFVAGANAGGVNMSFAPTLFSTFLTRAQFQEFVWPDYKALFDTWAERGGTTFILMEGSWKHIYDMLNDCKKASIIAAVEKDDILDLKKTIGDQQSVAGGITLNELKFDPIEKCIEKLKKVIDVCAPGGGYLFTQSAVVISKNDINTDTMRAVNEFVCEYGRY